MAGGSLARTSTCSYGTEEVLRSRGDTHLREDRGMGGGVWLLCGFWFEASYSMGALLHRYSQATRQFLFGTPSQHRVSI